MDISIITEIVWIELFPKNITIWRLELTEVQGNYVVFICGLRIVYNLIFFAIGKSLAYGGIYFAVENEYYLIWQE